MHDGAMRLALLILVQPHRSRPCVLYIGGAQVAQYVFDIADGAPNHYAAQIHHPSGVVAPCLGGGGCPDGWQPAGP